MLQGKRAVIYVMIAVGTYLRYWSYVIFNDTYYFIELNFNYREIHNHQLFSK